MAAWLKELFRRRVWEPLRLREAEERARRYAPEQHDRLRGFAKATLARLRSGRQLRDEEGLIAALSLYGEAARSAISGLVVATDASASELTLRPEQALTALDERLTQGALARTPDVEALQRLLSLSDPLALDRLAVDERRALALGAERAIVRILDAFEPRTVPELRVARIVRTTLAVTGVAALGLGVVMAISVAAQPDDASSAEFKQPAGKATKPSRPRKNR